MALDGLMINHLVKEIQFLNNGKIGKISQVGNNDFLFVIRALGKNNKLFILNSIGETPIKDNVVSFGAINANRENYWCQFSDKSVYYDIIDRMY